MAENRIDYDVIKRLLLAPDADLTQPIATKLITNTNSTRAPEGILELRGGICPFYSQIPYNRERGLGCNHCDLPAYSAGKPVDAQLIMQQIDTGLAQLIGMEDGRDMKVFSMFNGGSGLNPQEIPKEALFYLLKKSRRYHDDGTLPKLERVSIETREGFVRRDYIDEIVNTISPLKFEGALGYESHNPDVRNGDTDNSNGRIGLNKHIRQVIFERAIHILGEAGADAKSYVMLGAVPWLRGEEKIQDVVWSEPHLVDSQLRELLFKTSFSNSIGGL